MPVYEYTCKKCGHRFEKLLKNAEAETVLCPNCGSTEAIKEFSSFSSTGSTPATSCNKRG
jgi:putative FmdB family regulatory protein